MIKKRKVTKMGNQNLKELVTDKVRLSFAHLFTPYAGKNGEEPKYSVTILVPKTDITTKQRIDAAINAAVQEGISSKWNGVRPPVISIPVHDGDGVRPSDGMPFSEDYRGHWVFSASSKQPPEIVDQSMQRIINQSEIYSGVYARVQVRFFSYASNGKKGIGCSLGPVQKLEDGEPLGGRVSAAAAFSTPLAGYNPTPAQFQGYPQQSHKPVYNPQPTYSPQQILQYIPQQMPQYAPQVPAYTPQAQVYTPHQPVYNQPAYTSPAYPGQPQMPLQFDPITGAPLNGGIMGINSDIPF
jgi:hypothetical protein